METTVIPIKPEETSNVVQESPIQFKSISDKVALQIHSKDGELVAQISGYGMELGFNYKFFKNEEDIQAAANGIAELAVRLIMESMVNQVNNTLDRK